MFVTNLGYESDIIALYWAVSTATGRASVFTYVPVKRSLLFIRNDFKKLYWLTCKQYFKTSFVHNLQCLDVLDPA